MKRGITLLGFIIVAKICIGCDICGSSFGNYQLSTFRMDNGSYIAMRYAHQKFFSRMADDLNDYSADHYQLVELSGGMKIGKQFQMEANLPYRINRQVMRSHTHSGNGIGDVTVFGKWIVPVKDGQKNRFIISSGVKLPTGEFVPDLEHHPIPAANLQTGTGSVDFILNATNMLLLNKWSIIGDARYKINTEANNYRFGNRFTSTLIISGLFEIKDISMRFNNGAVFEDLNDDKLDGVVNIKNGGCSFRYLLGLDIHAGRFGIGFNFQLPIGQNLSEGQTEFKNGSNTQISFNF